MARFLTATLTAFLFLFIHSAHATPVTFQFAGTITQAPVDEVFGDVNFGDAIQGSYTFDSSAIDQIPDAATGSYTSLAPFGMQASIDGHEFLANGFVNIGVLNSTVDQYTVLAESEDASIALELFLQDNSGTAFSSDRLPLSPPQLDAFGQRDFHLDAVFDGNEIQADGQLTSLTTAPEPSPAYLALGGLLLAAGLARSKRSRK